MPNADAPPDKGPLEDAQAFWEGFAGSRTVSNEQDTAGLALFGSRQIYDAYRDRAEKITVHEILPEIQPSWRVLDLGCGPGRWTVPMAKQCAQVVALDFSEQMLAHARKNCETAHVAGKVAFKRQGLDEVNVQELGGPFHLVLAMGVLQYLPKEKIPGVLDNLCECVGSGGLLIHREYRSPDFIERRYNDSSKNLLMRSFYKPFDFYRQLYEARGLKLQVRRSIIPPSILYSLYSRVFPLENACFCLKTILAMHEWVLDPLWRIFPGMLWKVNSRRATDQVAALYRKES